MKRFIYVAGIDYEFKGVDFRIFANNRMKRRINSNKAKDELAFTIFDVHRGEVYTNSVTYPKGKKAEAPATTTPKAALTKANYDASRGADGETHYRFKDGQRDKMSIVDVYKEVQKIGSRDPGTLVELSFFSHAWYGGPILVNSYDDAIVTTTPPGSATPVATPVPVNARDPDDMDPRGAKDFIAPTMTAVQLDNFQKAFGPNSFIWIWGCTFPRLVHEFLHKVEHHPKYKDTGVGDDEVFNFKRLDSAMADYLEAFLSPALGGPFPDKKNIDLKFKFIKYFFCLMTVSTYVHTIAVNSKVKAFGANVGTYADYDEGVSLPLMNVHSGFTRHFTFYKNYMGFAFDPEGRRYGEYRPNFTCSAPPP